MFISDLKKGYFHVKMHKKSLLYMGFCWKEKWYRYLVLPFGLKHSPIVFSRIVKAMIKFWRLKGIFVIAYLDDFLFMALKWKEEVQQDFQNLGWIWEDSKSIWEPTQDSNF